MKISEQDMGFYTRLAKGGVGYIVMGDVAPINSFFSHPKLFDDSQIPAFKALADSVHAYGTNWSVPALSTGVRRQRHQQSVYAEKV